MNCLKVFPNTILIIWLVSVEEKRALKHERQSMLFWCRREWFSLLPTSPTNWGTSGRHFMIIKISSTLQWKIRFRFAFSEPKTCLVLSQTDIKHDNKYNWKSTINEPHTVWQFGRNRLKCNLETRASSDEDPQ